VKRPARLLLLIEPPRLRTHTLRVEISECIQLRIEQLDLLNVCLGQLRHGEFAGVQKLELAHR
jgi:hypothetical protein